MPAIFRSALSPPVAGLIVRLTAARAGLIVRLTATPVLLVGTGAIFQDRDL